MDPHLHYNAIGMNSFRKARRLEQAAIAVANMSEHLRAKPRMDGILFKLLVRIRFLISKFSGKYKISGYTKQAESERVNVTTALMMSASPLSGSESFGAPPEW